MAKYFNVPTLLTLSRLILSPLVLPVLLVYLLPLNVFWINVFLASLFLLFSLTDFFDGYLARKYDQETVLGKILDPVADKVLVYSTLVALLAINKIFFYWVIVLVGREFFVMGLRHIALQYSFDVSVSLLGKLKTVAQMVLITFLIVNPYQSIGLGFSGIEAWNGFELLLLITTLVLTLVSARQYYFAFMQKYKQTTAQHHNETPLV